MDKWMGGWVSGWMDGWVDGWLSGWAMVDEGLDGRGVDGSLGRWRKGGSKKKS